MFVYVSTLCTLCICINASSCVGISPRKFKRFLAIERAARHLRLVWAFWWPCSMLAKVSGKKIQWLLKSPINVISTLCLPCLQAVAAVWPAAFTASRCAPASTKSCKMRVISPWRSWEALIFVTSMCNGVLRAASTATTEAPQCTNTSAVA